MEQQYVSLQVERDGPVARVMLLGPGKGNAMGPDFWRELPLVFRDLDADPDVRALVLTGGGGNFSYGLDLPAMLGSWDELLEPGAPAEPRTRFLGVIRELQAAVSAVADCRTPVRRRMCPAHHRYSSRCGRRAVNGSSWRLAHQVRKRPRRVLGWHAQRCHMAGRRRRLVVREAHSALRMSAKTRRSKPASTSAGHRSSSVLS